MKVYEITAKNEMWSTLKGVNYDFESEFKHVVNTYDLITSLKHRSKYPIIIDMIENLEYDISVFLNTNFPDISDQDLIDHTRRAHMMLTKLDNLKTSIVE